MKTLHTAARLAAIAGLMTSAMVSAQDTKAANAAASGADSKFAMEAAQGGMAEVELGRLATQKAASDDVKKFGQRMVDDHTKANDQLKSIASQKNITLPTDVGAKNKTEMDRLSKLDGAAFDKAYMSHMSKDHHKDVAEFQKEANNGKDSDLKNFAAQTLPTLQEHMRMADEINGKVSGSGSADRSKSGEEQKK